MAAHIRIPHVTLITRSRCTAATPSGPRPFSSISARSGFETFQLTASRYNLAPSGPRRRGRHHLLSHRALVRVAAHKLPVINQLTVVRELRARLDEVVSETRPDVIHAHSPCLTALAALPVARRRGIPLAVRDARYGRTALSITAPIAPGSLRYRASRALETYALRRVNAVTTICEGLRGEIASPAAYRPTRSPSYAMPWTRSASPASPPVIPPSSRRTASIPDRCSVSSDRSTAEATGRCCSTAVRRLKESFPHLRVLLVGGGPEVAALQGAGDGARHRRARRVHRSRAQRPHPGLLRARGPHDLSAPVHAPHRAVTPPRRSEAMALGRPLAASDVGGHRELIRDGVDGVLFAAGDPGAPADAVTKLLNDAPKARCSRARTATRSHRHGAGNSPSRPTRACTSACSQADGRGRLTRPSARRRQRRRNARRTQRAQRSVRLRVAALVVDDSCATAARSRPDDSRGRNRLGRRKAPPMK